MRLLTTRLAMALALVLGIAQLAQAGPDRDRENDRGDRSNVAIAYSHGGGPTPGSCVTGRAEKDLDVNNALARVFNTGSLFFGNSSEAAYLVPQSSGLSPIYASGIWIGGTVGGELRVAGATYNDFEFWPGPINADGTLPSPDDCSIYDRIYKVGRLDIINYDATGMATTDLAEWPADLGAPVIAAPGNGVDDDGDGLVDEGTDGADNDGDGLSDERDEQERRIDGGYDLAAGDRPEIVGDQALWWVMNDLGNEHRNSLTPPLGVEVQVLAWSFARADALGETTFYRYRVINKSGAPIDDTFLAIFSDPDLGDASDDFVGVDTTLSLGFVFNADDDDSPSSGGYGTPPAAGYDYFQGPIVDLDGDGTASDTLGVTAFMYFINGLAPPITDPANGTEIYEVMQGRWTDGTPMEEGGNGYQSGGPVTTFAFPGDPVTGAFWSEDNTDGSGTPTDAGGDRRLVMGTGPFTLEPDVPQDIVYGLVFGQGSDRLSSVSALRGADQLAQTAYDIDFELPLPPPAPSICDPNSPNPAQLPGSGSCFEAVEEGGRVTLVWGYPTTSSNYLGQFEAEDRLLSGLGATDSTYSFEGFNIYRYANSGFPADSRELAAVIDVANGVTTVVDEAFDAEVGGLVPFIAARGTDTGLRYYFELEGLTNHTDYYYGISAYAHNDESTPKVIESAPVNITVRPSLLTATNGGSHTSAEVGDLITADRLSGSGAADISVRVVDPTRITGATYRVEFYEFDADGTPMTTYTLKRDGSTILNGAEIYAATGRAPSVDGDNFIIDGLEFFGKVFDIVEDVDEVRDWSGDAKGIIEISYAGSSDVCPEGSTDFGCSSYAGEGNTVWHDTNSNGDYYVTAGGGSGDEARINRYVASAAPDDYEIRFGDPGVGVHAFTDDSIIDVPFSLWNLGTTPDDPSDDARMIPFINPNAGVMTTFAGYTGTDAWAENPCGAATPCAVSDWIYGMQPDDDGGYDAFAAAAAASGGAGSIYVDTDTSSEPDPEHGGECANFGYYANFCFRNNQGSTVVGANATGATFVYPIGRVQIADLAADGTLPPSGTTIRMKTVKPLLATDDVFEFSTADLAFTTGDAADAEAALDLMAIVPNPYMGVSAYETGNLSRVVRFTNLPEVATIRVYTVAGTLVKTLTKDGPSRQVDWDLETDNNLPIASGMYLVHIDVPGVGERVIKFGVVQRQTRISVF